MIDLVLSVLSLKYSYYLLCLVSLSFPVSHGCCYHIRVSMRKTLSYSVAMNIIILFHPALLSNVLLTAEYFTLIHISHAVIDKYQFSTTVG